MEKEGRRRKRWRRRRRNRRERVLYERVILRVVSVQPVLYVTVLLFTKYASVTSRVTDNKRVERKGKRRFSSSYAT